MKITRVAGWCLLVVGLLVSGCGDAAEEGGGGGKSYAALPEADPLQWSETELGVTFIHGQAAKLESSPTAGDDVLQTSRSVFKHTVLHVDIYDEKARLVGESTAYPPSDQTGYRGPDAFQGNNAAAGRLGARAGDLATEVQSAVDALGTDPFVSTSVVVDFWRARDDWYIRWDGNLDDAVNREGKGPYGLYQQEMVDDIIAGLVTIAEDHQPRYIIVGSGMERLLGAAGGGLSPVEYSNFVVFFQKAYAAIKAASPQTQVGAGIHWDNFAEQVAPMYAGEDGEVDDAALDAAFEAVVLPLVDTADIVALKSAAAPDDWRVGYYQFLRRLESLYGITKPLVWYSIGSPVESSVAYVTQKNYLEAFAEWTAGLDPAFVAWRSLLNFDGVDRADNTIGGRCEGLTSESNNIGMPLSRCYDGLFTTSFQPKAPMDYFEQQAGR